MARKTAPCGTEAAYRRHRRNNEQPCDACKRAAAEARRERLHKKKPPRTKPAAADAGEAMAKLRPDLFTEDIDPDDVEDLDDHRERLWIYAMLKTAMRYAMPRETASIAKELRALITELTADAAADGDDIVTEFQRAVQEREARERDAGVSAAAH